MAYPEPCSIYLRGTLISLKELVPVGGSSHKRGLTVDTSTPRDRGYLRPRGGMVFQ